MKTRSTVSKKLTAFILAAVLALAPATAFAADANTLPFEDVENGSWYYNATAYCYEHSLMTGVEAQRFSPSMLFTRAQAVMVMAKTVNADLSAYKSSRFADVPSGSWFMSAAAWADENGIAVGYDGRFSPNESVTREQFAVMASKLAQKFNITNKFLAHSDTIDVFADADTASLWATGALEWAYRNGLIAGRSNSSIAPRATLTRAEAAVIMSNLHYLSEHGFFAPDTADADSLVIGNAAKKRIVCWGDSLTAGAGVTQTYPFVLQNLTGVRCHNYGVGGETTETIAMRLGSIPFFAAPFTIPAECEPVKVELVNEEGKHVDVGLFGTSGVNTAVIAGVRGDFKYSDEEKCCYFTREEEGDAVTVTRLTRVITLGMRARTTEDIVILWVGTNNGYSPPSLPKLIARQHDMLDYCGSDKYIIVGFTAKPYFADIAALNEGLAEEFGEHFLDIRSYFLTDALADAGIAPTEQDRIDIADGQVPSSLRKPDDGAHGNEIFYRLLAEQLYKKLTELGYIDQ